jgi:hypothetical protein
MIQLYLTRRNLQTLLNKLDRNRTTPGASQCKLLKQDTLHPVYALKEPIMVTALEDEEYYTDRSAGQVHPEDVPMEDSRCT